MSEAKKSFVPDPQQSVAYNLMMSMTDAEYAAYMATFTHEQLEALQYDADFWLRPSQMVPDGDWRVFAMCAGRGFGKTLALAQWVRKVALSDPKARIAIVARTAADARDTLILGDSGILAVHHPSERPEYKPSTRRLDWPNGAQATILSAESPDQARGGNYSHAALDEYAAFPTKPDASGATMVSNIKMATRLGNSPKLFIATTPKRTSVMASLISDSKDPSKRTIVITGSTLDNKNLSADFIDGLLSDYEGSSLARQEIYGEMLDGVQGAVFTDKMIEDNRIPELSYGKLPLRVIAVDPTTAAEPRDTCGIIAIGCTIEKDISKRTAYILDDQSIKAAPQIWAQRVVDTAKKWGTDYVVIERNAGGQLLVDALHAVNPKLKIFTVVATQGKALRAEPVVIALEQGRVKFPGFFEELEAEMIYWDPNESGSSSPDHLDAMVWGVVSTIINPPRGLYAAFTRVTNSVGIKIPMGRGQGKARTFKRSQR